MSLSISLTEARAIAVASQGFGLDNVSLRRIFERVKSIQLDPLKAVRESHELVCLSRGLSLTEARLILTQESAFPVFTFPGHAMAILPLSFWPWFAFMRRRIRVNGWRGPDVNAAALCAVRELLHEKKGVTVKDFPKANGSGWNRLSPWRTAAEWLLWTGEAVSTTRDGTRRIYRLAQDSIPAGLFNFEPSDDECFSYLIQAAIDALGVATVEDIADYFRLPRAVVKNTLEQLDCLKGTVEGWKQPVWLSRRAEELALLKLDNITLLSPFDSLVWYRPRLHRLFSKLYKLESYKPAHSRYFGHYFMPILWGTKIVGRIAPRRCNNKIWIEAHELDAGIDCTIMENIQDILQKWGEASVSFGTS
ncbi:DNA glycosylase AlkZ-like family protein [Bartonella sp. DGB1]|uniref:DNA glycosylase AlkZ-like family protein n=1 Tax=Bartonella sp. DGB1 TaxID=3239807 RepID=UPI0035264D1F